MPNNWQALFFSFEILDRLDMIQTTYGDILFKLSREDKYMKLVSLGRINGVSQQKVPLQEFLYYDGFFEKFKDTMQ